MLPTPVLLLLGWSQPDPWHGCAAFHLLMWHPAHWQGLVPALATNQCRDVGIDSSVPIAGTAASRQPGHGAVWAHRHRRIPGTPQQIVAFGVTKAFAHSPGFLSCSVTQLVATEPWRKLGAAGELLGGHWSQLCRWWPVEPGPYPTGMPRPVATTGQPASLGTCQCEIQKAFARLILWKQQESLRWYR